jgi:ATP-dependent Clp protease ATP-binding subunit ClpB
MECGSNEAAERLAHLGFDPHFGARPLKRVQLEILNELSKGILSGAVSKDSVIEVGMKNEVEFEFGNG